MRVPLIVQTDWYSLMLTLARVLSQVPLQPHLGLPSRRLQFRGRVPVPISDRPDRSSSRREQHQPDLQPLEYRLHTAVLADQEQTLRSGQLGLWLRQGAVPAPGNTRYPHRRLRVQSAVCQVRAVGRWWFRRVPTDWIHLSRSASQTKYSDCRGPAVIAASSDRPRASRSTAYSRSALCAASSGARSPAAAAACQSAVAFKLYVCRLKRRS